VELVVVWEAAVFKKNVTAETKCSPVKRIRPNSGPLMPRGILALLDEGDNKECRSRLSLREKPKSPVGNPLFLIRHSSSKQTKSRCLRIPVKSISVPEGKRSEFLRDSDLPTLMKD
jgi:hypothetical protein